ncbi:MAG TPA: hypothetical protein VFN67_20000, partial [Polyangiales bacterium]|nr:hypothetical protein [Polyangiales bacterium]
MTALAAPACDTTSASKHAAADAAPADASDAIDASDATREPANRPGFCESDDEDSVRDVFCADAPPEVRSLSDLQKRLQLDPASKDPGAPYVGAPISDNPHSAQRPIAVLSHSTSLSGRLVSPINPRVIILGTHTIMAFSRGLQRVELIAFSRKRPSDLNFYLVSFEQACNQHEGGCNAGELYTDRVESSWTSVSIQDDEELENTPLDCRVCHQRARETPQLLMRELEGPWTHFFLPADLGKGLQGVTGSELMSDFVAAKGAEIYANYDLTTIPLTSPFLMQ